MHCQPHRSPVSLLTRLGPGHLVPVILTFCILSLSALAQITDADNLVIWVNTGSGVYHCPDSPWYGQTKQGKYMKQGQAVDEGL
jgi:hypothetical protein